MGFMYPLGPSTSSSSVGGPPTVADSLLPGETLLFSHSGTGLYRGQTRWGAFEYGTVHLTSHRLLFISTTHPAINRVALDLANVQGMATYGGFLIQSSPKITLELGPGQGSNSSPSMIPRSLSTSALVHAPTAHHQSASADGEWTCAVCGCGNEGSIRKCMLCGVKRPAHRQPSVPMAPTPPPPISHSLSSTPRLPCSEPPTPGAYLTCPVCTFHNHLELNECEMCGTALAPSPSLGGKDRAPAFPYTEANAVERLKVSFREGGYNEAVLALNRILMEKAWEIPIELAHPQSTRVIGQGPSTSLGGITNILHGVQVAGDLVESNLSQAFTDLDGLMSKAKEMTLLAETMATRAGIPKGSSFSAHLQHLGVENTLPSYTDSGGALTCEALERTLLPPIESAGGMLALVDAYCLCNRIRGIDPVSSIEFRRVCTLLDGNGRTPSLVLRNYSQGVLVLSSVKMTNEMVREEMYGLIRERGSITSVEAAQALGRSVMLVDEQLAMCEESGGVCRDLSLEGVRFFENTLLRTPMSS